MLRNYSYLSMIVLVILLNLGCSAGRKWGLAKKEKSGADQQLEHNQNEALKAMMEEQGVPRKFDDLKDPLSLQIAYAKWQEQIGQHKEAKLTYEKALDKNPNSVEAQIGLARIEQLAERFPQAERAYKKALSMDPQSPMAMQALANFYISQERTSEALPLLSKLVDIEPTNKSYRYDYAVALVNSGKPDLALSHMTYSVGEPEALYNIGYLLQQNGHKADGENYMKLALVKKPELEQARSWVENQHPTGKTVLTSFSVPVNERKISGEEVAQNPQQVPVIQPSSESQTPAVIPSSTSASQKQPGQKGWSANPSHQQQEQLRNQSNN